MICFVINVFSLKIDISSNHFPNCMSLILRWAVASFLLFRALVHDSGLAE